MEKLKKLSVYNSVEKDEVNKCVISQIEWNHFRNHLMIADQASNFAKIFEFLAPKKEHAFQKKKSQSQNLKKHFEFSRAHCLKITHKVAFEFLDFGIFHQFLSY